jgi:hypothetical protein
MEAVEPYLVELIKKLADMRTPITTSQGLQLANSLIEGKEIQKKLEKWKSKYCQAYKKNGKLQLGQMYWKNFMKRNKHLIRAKKNSQV